MTDCRCFDVNVHNVKTEREIKPTREQTNWAGKLMSIPSLWRDTKGSGVKVAVLDTGADIDHRDLKPGILKHQDFTSSSINDVQGHGTHVAGIIGARKNGFGFVGVAPECKLMIGKVLDDNGNGNYAWISAGIRWAVQNGADIINMSLGGTENHISLFDAVHYALYKGVIIVVAAGNAGSMGSNSIAYPGKYGGVITVASHDNYGNRSGFSSHGGEIDILGPGSKIWSTYPDNKYSELSGTSMAAPFVSGLAALILAKHKKHKNSKTPIRNTEEMREHLLRMAAHPGWHDNKVGYGPLMPFENFYT